MGRRRFEKFQYRQVVARLRDGDSDRVIAQSGLNICRTVEQVTQVGHACVVPSVHLASIVVRNALVHASHRNRDEVRSLAIAKSRDCFSS